MAGSVALRSRPGADKAQPGGEESWGVSFNSDEPPTLRLTSCPFAFPRTPLPIAETPVLALIGARPCGATDLSVFHRLDAARKRGQGRGVRKRSSDRLQRRPSRGPPSPLAGDTY